MANVYKGGEKAAREDAERLKDFEARADPNNAQQVAFPPNFISLPGGGHVCFLRRKRGGGEGSRGSV